MVPYRPFWLEKSLEMTARYGTEHTYLIYSKTRKAVAVPVPCLSLTIGNGTVHTVQLSTSNFRGNKCYINKKNRFNSLNLSVFTNVVSNSVYIFTLLPHSIPLLF